MTPVFLFSLPRAGSTLLQRLMAAHPQVATSAEPWLLLPMLSLWGNVDCYANYNHRLTCSAIRDIATRLPGGEQRLRKHQREYCEAVYRDLSEGRDCRYFVDKTPRYHLIAKEIAHTFPEARFIFLWRNPLAVIASMCETWYDSKWDVYRHKFDLYNGVQNLVEAAGFLGKRACCLNYENLVSNKQETLARLAEYLELEPFSGELAAKPEGKYGDPTGSIRYKEVTPSAADKWKHVFNTPVRKRWARHYLEWVGEERLAHMGYPLETLRTELAKSPASWKGVTSDLYHLALGEFYSIGEPIMWINKWRNFRNGYPTLLHK